MCYDIKSHKKKQLKEAVFKGADSADIEKLEREIEELEKMLPEYHHISGFDHPDLVVITSELKPMICNWGFIPFWVKDEVSAEKIRNTTLNARGETIFEKPAFKAAAKNRRCLVLIDGFYEHHHHNGKTYPFHIKYKDDKTMVLAGLWERWKPPGSEEYRHTLSIVTAPGNRLLSKIHNNPKMEGPRMPLILSGEEQINWLKAVENSEDVESLKQMIRPSGEEELVAYTVPALRGKKAVGNSPLAAQEHSYDDFNYHDLLNK